MTFDFAATIWLWEGGAWHFLTVPEEVSDEIADLAEGRAGGFGSVRVESRIGSTTWRTSLFPSREHGAYLLPVKKAVREAEECPAGVTVQVHLTVLI